MPAPAQRSVDQVQTPSETRYASANDISSVLLYPQPSSPPTLASSSQMDLRNRRDRDRDYRDGDDRNNRQERRDRDRDRDERRLPAANDRPSRQEFVEVDPSRGIAVSSKSTDPSQSNDMTIRRLIEVMNVFERGLDKELSIASMQARKPEIKLPEIDFSSLEDVKLQFENLVKLIEKFYKNAEMKTDQTTVQTLLQTTIPDKIRNETDTANLYLSVQLWARDSSSGSEKVGEAIKEMLDVRTQQVIEATVLGFHYFLKGEDNDEVLSGLNLSHSVDYCKVKSAIEAQRIDEEFLQSISY